MTVLVAAASLTVTGYSCALAVHAQHARMVNSAHVVSGIAAAASSATSNPAMRAAKAGNGTSGATSPGNATPGSTPPSGEVPKGGPGGTGTPPASQPITLTARDRAKCPAAATACVDLAEKITWLQAGGKVSYGPVHMEPGTPGTVHATPAGTFNVAWKAGPTYKSTIYHELIPWAVFFAPGGIAFHEGSLTNSSHGCVHLTMTSAHYYNEHLPVGAEVVVF